MKPSRRWIASRLRITYRNRIVSGIFNPPHASHYGGVWERQIGTIRHILDDMLLELGARQLTHELLVTIMSEVVAIPSDIDEPLPLTPAMLLKKKTRPLGPLPGTFTTQDVYARQRWRKLQFLAGQFWTRWRREYIQNLQVRTKWNKEQRNLAVGDIVLMKDEQAHRNKATRGTFFWKNCEARVAENFTVLSDFWENTKKTNILKEGIWNLLHGLRKKIASKLLRWLLLW